MNKKSLKQIIIDKIFTILYEENPDTINLIQRVGVILGVAILGEFDKVDIVGFLKDIRAYPGMDYLFVYNNDNVIILPVYNNVNKSEIIELFLLLIPDSFVWDKPTLQCLFPIGYLKRNYFNIKIMTDEYTIMDISKEKIVQLLDKLQISWSLL
jgi:hypothetical protein